MSKQLPARHVRGDVIGQSMTLEELARIIENVARTGPAGQTLERLEIEPDTDDEGEEFIRVKLFISLRATNVDDDLESALEQIEDAVAAVDDRYASVRFLDAA